MTQPLTLHEWLGFADAVFDDPMRGDYPTLFELWYMSVHDGRTVPSMYDDKGRLWKLLPREARLCAMAYIQHGYFDAVVLADYKRELAAACLARDLDDGMFVKELAALNRPFLKYIQDTGRQMRHTHKHVLGRHGADYCPGCNAAVNALVAADNGVEIFRALEELPQGRREVVLELLGFDAHVETFRIASAGWFEEVAPQRFKISGFVCE